MLFAYLFVACSYFGFLVLLVAKDEESSVKDPIHLKVAIIASAFWPLVMPVSLLELKAKADRKAKDEAFAAMPKPVSMADGEVRYIKQIEQTEESTEENSSPIYGI